jgi:dTDP-4-dehydrorhamnose reductase
MVIGASGLLGSHLAEYTKDRYDVIATFNNHPFEIAGCKTVQMDLTDSGKTKNTILKEDPDCIILSAAQRNVDYCEKNQKEVTRINVTGALNVAVASKQVQAKLIYISTDLVFDGAKGMYKEDDPTNPVQHYGKTKLKGEQEVASKLDDYAIARVSVLYDWNRFDHTTNFVTWIFKRLEKKEPLSLFPDQFRCATYIKNSCEALLSIYEKDEKGIFHVAGKNCVSRYYIGLQVAKIFGFDENLITTMKSSESEWIAKRPSKCCLDVGKMEKKLGVNSYSIEQGLEKMKEELDNLK